MLEFGADEVLVGRSQGAGAATLQVRADVPEHTHTFIELAFVLAGSARHRSLAGTRRVRRGNVVMVRPGSWHAYDRPDSLVVTNAYLRSGLVHRELAWLMDHPSLATSLLRAGVSFATVDETTLSRAVNWLRQLEDTDTSAHPMVQVGLMTCVLSELVGADFAVEPARLALAPTVRSTMTRLAEHVEHPWTLDELARSASVSPSTLQRQFAQQVGQTPLAWLRQVRGEHAASLLVQTDLPVADIGRRVGWDDPNYMSRRFRAIYGVSPSGYRVQFKASQPGREVLR